MRPRVPLGCRLMLTGLSPSQVCSWTGSRLSAYTQRLLYYNEQTMVIHIGKAWRERLVNWVEKSCFEKIRRLLKVS